MANGSNPVSVSPPSGYHLTSLSGYQVLTKPKSRSGSFDSSSISRGPESNSSSRRNSINDEHYVKPPEYNLLPHPKDTLPASSSKSTSKQKKPSQNHDIDIKNVDSSKHSSSPTSVIDSHSEESKKLKSQKLKSQKLREAYLLNAVEEWLLEGKPFDELLLFRISNDIEKIYPPDKFKEDRVLTAPSK